jgi:hypothetical protein
MSRQENNAGTKGQRHKAEKKGLLLTGVLEQFGHIHSVHHI